jgi:hypothetical protein
MLTKAAKTNYKAKISCGYFTFPNQPNQLKADRIVIESISESTISIAGCSDQVV